VSEPAWLNQTVALVYNWKWVDAALTVWTSYLGVVPFYTIVAAVAAGVTWVSTNSVIAAGAVLTLVGVILGGSVLDPQLKLAAYLMILTGIAAIIYRLLRE